MERRKTNRALRFGPLRTDGEKVREIDLAVAQAYRKHPRPIRAQKKPRNFFYYRGFLLRRPGLEPGTR